METAGIIEEERATYCLIFSHHNDGVFVVQEIGNIATKEFKWEGDIAEQEIRDLCRTEESTAFEKEKENNQSFYEIMNNKMDRNYK